MQISKARAPPSKPKRERIVADAMLAKLARWMRLLGIGVESAPYIEDARILRYVKRVHAVLLTSDKALYARALKAKVRSVLVTGKGLESQLVEVFDILGLKPSLDKEICPLCNSNLRKITKDSAIKHGLSKKISLRYPYFYYCPKCKKVYWRGSHWKRVEKTARRILKELRA
ncbi:MAG: Mut7-C RNAse domain-containing protein [Candidatus Micrarchaeia archaeon]